ncbi:MAG: class B sortase [Oscillospiraceae bacterium]|nr:class B sortase [Oscillospiraceae bacterium]
MKDKNQNKTKKSGGRRRTVRIVLISVLCAVFIFSGVKILAQLNEYRVGTGFYSGLQSYISVPDGGAINENTVSGTPVETEPDWESLTNEEKHERAKVFYSLPEVDFDALRAINPDVVAWLYAPALDISYPLVQSTGSNDYYLYRLYDRTRNKAGSLFLDKTNSPDFTDKNTIVYGHNMKNKAMFGRLKEYRDQAFLDANPAMFIIAPSGIFRLDLITASLFDDTLLPTVFEVSGDFDAFLAEILAKAVTSRDVAFGEDDRLVSLSTCEYDFREARLVLTGKLTELWSAAPQAQE